MGVTPTHFTNRLWSRYCGNSSRRTALDYVNGAGADYSYDTASRLSYLDNQTGNGQHKYSYAYDNVGNRTSMMVNSRRLGL